MKEYRSNKLNIPVRRAMWLALGKTEEDLVKPKIAIVNSSSNYAVCFSHLDEIARVAAKEVEAAGGRIAVTVNLLSAAGLSDVRYGEDVSALISAAGGAVVEAMPEQFGNGVTSEELTLTAPALDPYGTLSQAFAACGEALSLEEGEAVMAAMVQAYTSSALEPAVNKTYGPEEIRDQVRAVTEAGIGNILYYHPQGDYSALG